MRKTTRKRRKGQNLKSSQDARDLIAAALRHKNGGTYRAAARLLEYNGSIAALYKMKVGSLRDTPAMRRIIIKRKRAARVRFLSFTDRAETRSDKILRARIAVEQIAKAADEILMSIDR